MTPFVKGKVGVLEIWKKIAPTDFKYNVCYEWVFSRSRRPFCWMSSGQRWIYEIIDSQRIFKGKIWNWITIAVPAGGLALVNVGPFSGALMIWFNFNPCIGKYHIPSNVWYEITYPFRNGGTVEVWEWISNSIPFHPTLLMDMITYQCKQCLCWPALHQKASSNNKNATLLWFKWCHALSAFHCNQ